MTTTTQEYDRYWRETAQFFEPCDRVTGDDLEPFRKFGHHLYEDIHALRHEIESAHQAELEVAEDKVENVESAFKELKQSLTVAIDEETDIAVLKQKINTFLAT